MSPIHSNKYIATNFYGDKEKKKKIKNSMIPMKISHNLCVRMDGTQFLWLWWFTAKNHSPKTFQPAVYLCLKLLYSSLLKQWRLNYLDKKVPHCVLRFITLPLIYWIWTQKCKSEVYFQELLQFIPPFVLKWNTTPIPNAIQNLFFHRLKT